MVRPRVQVLLNSTRTGSRCNRTASGASRIATAPASPIVAVMDGDLQHSEDALV